MNRFVAASAAVAALLSALYVFVYLRGGPRIIDASAYFLEARMIAEGRFAFAATEPVHATLGRFLVLHPSGETIAVIFPPGYPALLALGFLAGAPLAVGPLIAAALVVVTYDLARRFEAPGERVSTARVAAALSVVCAALRYHTADTMSHGLAALCFAGSLAATLRALDADRGPARARAAIIAGLFAGWLLATRPASALALAATLAIAISTAKNRAISRRAVALLLLAGIVPGAVLLAAHAHAATGSWIGSAQRLYYATSDGPPDCFRYGFGSGVGCVGEHGDFVRANLAHGYGAGAAVMTTLRRLKMHLVDPANFEPFFLLVPAGAYVMRGQRRGWLLPVAIGLQIAAYAPFYFDGNYPAGGARFFADVLPLEHVLCAFAIVALAARTSRPPLAAAGAIAAVVLGFVVRASSDHAQLRDREGGRPIFEPRVVAAAGVHTGLLFVDTDHGFDLAFDPDPAAPLQVVRYHGDATDRLAWELRGRPAAYRYRYAFFAGETTRVEPYDPSTAGAKLEGESLWPPRSQDGGYALVEFPADPCVSRGSVLAIHASADRATVGVSIPPAFARGARLAPRMFAAAPGEVALIVDGRTVRTWRIDAGPPRCVDLEPASAPIRADKVDIRMSTVLGSSDEAANADSPSRPFSLDALEIKGVDQNP